jgi:hypothetical protein
MLGKINWKPTNRDLTKFGVTLLIGFGVISVFLFFGRDEGTLAMSLCLAAAIICLFSVLAPATVKPLYFIWMGLAFIIGAIMSRIIISIIFYAVISPVALFFKLKGRDVLFRKRKRVETYWNDHPSITDKDYYTHLF